MCRGGGGGGGVVLVETVCGYGTLPNQLLNNFAMPVIVGHMAFKSSIRIRFLPVPGLVSIHLKFIFVTHISCLKRKIGSLSFFNKGAKCAFGVYSQVKQALPLSKAK